MLESLKNHKMPLAVTGAGLFVALIFGVSPFFESDEPKAPKPVEVVEVNQPSAQPMPSSVEDRLNALEASLNGRLSAIELNIQNLNKAAGRLAGKVNRLSKEGADEGLTEELAQLRSQSRNFEAQIHTLNKAVPRLHMRYVSVAKDMDEQKTNLGEYTEAMESLRNIFKAN